MRKLQLGFGIFAAIVAAAIIYEIDRNDSGLVSGPAGAATPSPAMMAMPVPVTKIVRKTLPIYLEYSARTESPGSLTLQAKVSGYLMQQVARDGSDVRERDPLYRIDARDYQVALDQAEAQAQRDTAAREYARANFDRGAELSKSGNLAKDGFDQRESLLHQAEASLAQDQAAIHAAKLNLSHTEITAPFAGRIGKNQAPIGTLVSAGGAPLNTLVQLDPMYVAFNPSESDLEALQKARAAGPVEAEVLRPGESKAVDKGELTFIDNAVDRGTGTITARVTIANSDFHWLPGQYVRVRLHVMDRPNTLMTPLVSLGSSQLGKYVYVVGQGDKVDLRLVSLGPTDGGLIAVDGAVAEGDRVIVGNLQKIGPGMPVKPMAGQP